MEKEFLKTTVVARINDTNVLASKSLQLVPVKPVCKALGVSYQMQEEKLKNHPVFAPTIMFSMIVASDGKYREMICIPAKYVFGWIFTIHPDNVKESVRQNLIDYQKECCEALYNYFFQTQTVRNEVLETIYRLEQRKKVLEINPVKSQDLTEYIWILKEIAFQKSKLGKNARIEQNNFCFTAKEMTGK